MNGDFQDSPLTTPSSTRGGSDASPAARHLPPASFLVLAPNPWHDIWRNRQQIFSRLAERHRIFYVEPARASLSDWRRSRIHAADRSQANAARDLLQPAFAISTRRPADTPLILETIA